QHLTMVGLMKRQVSPLPNLDSGLLVAFRTHGHHVWEMEAKTDKEMCKPNSLVVEIPPFRNQRITSPVQVNFYVCNGKRKRSQYQLFTYLPATVPIIKTEPTDDYEPAQTCGPMNQGLSPLSKPYYGQQIMMPPDPGSCLVAGFASCQQRNAVMSPSPNASPKLHDLSSSPYKCIPNPGHSHLGLPQPAGGVPTIQEVPRSIVVHPSSPEQSSHIMLQPQVSQHLSSSCPLGYQQTLYPNSPSSPVPSVTQEPTYLQSCSPTHSSIMGQQQQQLPKVHRNESPTTQPLSLPELHEESNHNLAPIPVTIKREPEELDQMYLDDGNDVLQSDLGWTCTSGLEGYPVTRNRAPTGWGVAVSSGFAGSGLPGDPPEESPRKAADWSTYHSRFSPVP
ncbi:PREDICTED: nuclear factor of activated T-cells, cytoplasmic 1-like, partial [Pterocles gutturalis]|uniref:nuclear factor of activated T-cells, cytoplasmic 1-like n=1 Tax=Pterocles gutturalis TaxID=240206 RepID=UPI00052830E0